MFSVEDRPRRRWPTFPPPMCAPGYRPRPLQLRPGLPLRPSLDLDKPGGSPSSLQKKTKGASPRARPGRPALEPARLRQRTSAPSLNRIPGPATRTAWTVGRDFSAVPIPESRGPRGAVRGRRQLFPPAPGAHQFAKSSRQQIVVDCGQRQRPDRHLTPSGFMSNQGSQQARKRRALDRPANETAQGRGPRGHDV